MKEVMYDTLSKRAIGTEDGPGTSCRPDSLPRPVHWPVERREIAIAMSLLLVFFGFRIFTTLELNALRAFDQYNLFFDADANQYVSAISNGWSFNRTIHPAFALATNVPVRLLEAIAAAFVGDKGAVLRDIAPIVFPALCGLIGGFFFWLACIETGLSSAARIGALALFQGSFSQTVFGAVPESYSLSGALLGIMLWAGARGAHRPERLSAGRSKLSWLLLATISSGITVTNGFLCVAAWVALRGGRTKWRTLALEGAMAIAIVTISIFIFSWLDRVVYTLENKDVSTNASEIARFGSKFGGSSLPERILRLPEHGLASVVAFPPDMITNALAEQNESLYKFQFSFQSRSDSLFRIVAGWLFIAATATLSLNIGKYRDYLRPCAAALLGNAAIHSVWGSEIFLYSQHWLPFLVFTLFLGLGTRGGRNGTVLISLAVLVTAWNSYIFSEMVDQLKTTEPAVKVEKLF